jgi:alginate O-acetyltransferase complex protein AlgI
VAERLRVEPARLLDEMRVLTGDGRVFGGADGAVELSRYYWWATPLVWLSKLPCAMELLRVAYRWMARRRMCGKEGACKASSFNTQASGKHQSPTSKAVVAAPKTSGVWTDWVPLAVLPVGVALLRSALPSWVFMWLLAFAMFLGCKWLTWRRALRNGCRGTIARSLGHFFVWPGMDAKTFLTADESTGRARRGAFLTAKMLLTTAVDDGGSLEFGTWSFAAAKTLAGAGLIWLAITYELRMAPIGAGWLAMIGIVLFLHFGVFDLLALAWHRAGVKVTPVMRAPLLATSLADFWSRRWNTAFHKLANELVFRPVGRRWGAVPGTIAVFLISGLVHDAVISFPARGGYGLPTTYFILQATGVLLERSSVGRRFKLGKGVRGWLYVVLFTAGPVFWLFHTAFIKNVILPMLHAFGAN